MPTTPEAYFTFVNMLVVPGWLMLVFLPRSKWTRVVAAYLLPAVYGVIYLWIMLIHFDGDSGGFGSIGEVARLFMNPWLLLAGWIHYLAFDLFVGAWEVRDAARLRIPHLVVVPCLVFTFLVGPVGLLMYFGIRAWIVREMPRPA